MPCVLGDLNLAPSNLAKTKIRSQDHVESTIKNLVTTGGKDNLQIIADFDYTLTNYRRKDGKEGRGSTTWEFAHGSNLIPGFFEGTKNIINKYRPIEVNPTLSIQDKIPYMAKAYEEVNQLILEHDFSSELMDRLMEESSIELRDGVESFLNTAYKNGIPVFIMTAGFGEVVVRLLKKLGIYHKDYTRVAGNFLEIEENKCIGLCQPYLHVYNKNGKLFLNSDCANKETMLNRKNLLLLGDSIGDLGMSEGLYDSRVGTLLKIGFLNHDTEDPEHLELYSSNYDIVLLDEESYTLPNSILNYVVQSK